MTTYDVGDTPLVSTTILVAGVATDATMAIARTAPDGTTDSPAITHGGTGQYSVNAAVTQPGEYLYRWTASGAAVGVDEYQISVQPPGFRLVGLTAAKNHINKTMAYTGDDNELRLFIDAAGELVDKLAGPTINRTVVEYHSGPAVELFLAKWPVVSVTSVVESWPGGLNYNLAQETDLGVPPSTGFDFTFDPTTGAITRRVNSWTYAFPPGRNNIKITYVAGRPQPWPATIRMAGLEEIAYLWRTSQTGRGAGRPGTGGSATDDTVMVAGFGAVPTRVVDLLGGLQPPQAGA